MGRKLKTVLSFRPINTGTGAGIALIAVLVVAFAPGRAAGAEEPAFCRSRMLHDYLAPLKHMPKARGVP
jgi:hypothetical protein